MNTIIVGRKYLPAIIHSYAMEHLYVTRVQGTELMKHVTPNMRQGIKPESHYYVECSKFGVVDWEDVKLHDVKDLVARDNVFIVEPN